jgi:hypothetical protein
VDEGHVPSEDESGGGESDEDSDEIASNLDGYDSYGLGEP